MPFQFAFVHYFTKVGAGEYYLEELEETICALELRRKIIISQRSDNGNRQHQHQHVVVEDEDNQVEVDAVIWGEGSRGSVLDNHLDFP